MYTQVRELNGDLTAAMIRRDADGAVIPNDPDNLDWQGYEAWRAEGNVAAEPEAPPSAAPDGPTLRDWRVALLLWGRLNEVSGKVNALVDKGDPMGLVARESLEYANNVLRSQLLQLRGVFGFTEAEVEESLWRAERVRLGDLSGQWPLPAAKKTA